MRPFAIALYIGILGAGSAGPALAGGYGHCCGNGGYGHGGSYAYEVGPTYTYTTSAYVTNDYPWADYASSDCYRPRYSYDRPRYSYDRPRYSHYRSYDDGYRYTRYRHDYGHRYYRHRHYRNRW